MAGERVHRPRSRQRSLWTGRAPRTALAVGVLAGCVAAGLTWGPAQFRGDRTTRTSLGAGTAPETLPHRPTLAFTPLLAARVQGRSRPATHRAAAPPSKPLQVHRAKGTVTASATAATPLTPAHTRTAASPAAVGAHPGWGCTAALAYLQVHANPPYRLVCPGYAEGHQAMTCAEVPLCPGLREIVIAVPCPAAYMNEAWNSWHITTGPFDPYGFCSDLS
jgi:hypothetical protein